MEQLEQKPKPQICNCIEVAEERLLGHLGKAYPNAEIIDVPKIQNKGFRFVGPTGYTFHAPIVAKYRDGKKIRRWEPNLEFTFCPICGQKYPTSDDK